MQINYSKKTHDNRSFKTDQQQYVISIIAELELICLDIHDQGYNNWMCWAYSIATMLRASLNLFILELLSNHQIEQSLAASLQKILQDINHHKLLRSELMMVVFPMRMNRFPDKDMASVSVVVEKVS